MGLFITFEGIEGSGKTTQIEKAGQYLSRQHIPHIITMEPGGTALGAELRNLLLARTSLRVDARTELFLFAADRMQHIEEVILPALGAGTMVLCDRFGDATVAYQGYGRMLDMDLVTRVNEQASRSLKPDLTVLFDLPVEAGLRRIRDRNVEDNRARSDDRFEREEVAFHERVRQGYLALARGEPGRFRIIDATGAMDEIHRKVVSFMAELMGR